jgi:hypothetical protein
LIAFANVIPQVVRILLLGASRLRRSDYANVAETHAVELAVVALDVRVEQNYRRAAGRMLAYAGTVEMQRRLATHAHFLVRGTAPRALTRRVAEGTYFQAWWPAFDMPVYTVDKPPVWDEGAQSYVDGKTKRSLTTWDQAMAALDAPDAQPAHVAPLGTIDLRGIEGRTRDAEKSVKYATKYLTKDLVDQTIVSSPEQHQHHH